MQDKNPITVAGKAKLEEELRQLMHVERPMVIKAIEEARAQGDISENAEYDAAKERQALVEGRLAELQTKIATAEVIDPSRLKSDKVIFGAYVTIVDTETEEESEYQIVGVDEVDVKQGKISVMSPLARALIGRKQGETVIFSTPKGERELEIVGLNFR